MPCCPNGVFPPLIVDCEGVTRKLTTGESLIINGQIISGSSIVSPNSLVLLEANRTIYVRDSGDDIDGDGSLANPFKTVSRAFDEFQLWVPGKFTITIDIGEGFFPLANTLRFAYPYGSALVWTGVIENHSSLTLQNFDVAATSGSPDFPELQYYEMEVVLPAGKTTAVGQFIGIITPSGGTNNQATWGLHRVQAWNAGTETATVRVWQRNGVPELPSGAITSNGFVVKTILQMSGDHGIEVNGPFSAGDWNNMVIEGDQDAYDNHSGLRIQNQGHITVGNRFGIHQWDIGIQPFNMGLIEASAGWISKIQTDGCRAQNEGIGDCRFGTRFNGCGRSAMWCLSSGVGYIRSSFVNSCGNDFAIHVEGGSYIDAESAEIYFDDGTSTAAIHAEKLSDINATGATVVGWTTTKSPATNPGNNEARIVGP